ncbi:pseudouridine synthase [Cytidiella melzeri]|nr:pseudouridine synthase [Cytidiella melzeri]
MLAASRSASTATTYKAPAAIPGWRQHAIYVDRAIVVLNKPTGLASQPAPHKARQEKSRPTTVRPILERFADSDRLPWPCHRLDKRTTGALVCGKNPSIQRDLHSQFASGHVERKYLAILRGGAKTFKARSPIVIQTLLETHDGAVSVPHDPGSSVEGKISETHLRVLASSPVVPLTLVELEAKTGRRHQLRVHATHIGAPILGDTRYARSKLSPQITEYIQDLQDEDNLYLHASYISFFRYRTTGQNKRFRLGIMAPLPPSFVALCQRVDIPIPEEYIEGGVYVDGEREESGILDDIEGRWRVKNRSVRPHAEEKSIT